MAIERVSTAVSSIGQPDSECNHHWVIGYPDGPISSGRCKFCGAEKDFMNYFEGSAWGSDVSLEQLSSSAGYSGGSNYASAAETVKEEEVF